MKYRVLLVDDLTEIRRILALMLEQSGWFDVVGEAGDGPQGVQMARDLQPDLVMLDVEMPGPTGWDVLPDIRRVAPESAVVVFTGTPGEFVVGPDVREMAAAVLEKGIATGDLVAELLAVVSKRDTEPGAREPRAQSAHSWPADSDEAAALLAALVESSPDAIVVIDLEGTVVSWNPGAERIYGYRADEIVGRPISTLVPEDRPDEVSRFLDASARGERMAPYETVRISKDGRRLDIALTVAPLIAPNGTILGASLAGRDISAKRDADVALGSAMARLEAQNRQLRRSNEELDSFAFVASHDLAQPLQVAYGYLEMLKAEFGATFDATAVTWLDAASGSLERMRRLVQDILEYSRTGSREAPKAPMELREAVDDALLGISAALAARDAQVDIGELPLVHGHIGQLSQLFQNLIGNAVKFVPEGTQPRVRITSRRAADAWVIDITDNGPGVPEAMREKVFDMFQRGKGHAASGTGLGLAIVKKLVTAHGGRVWVEDAPDGGAVFGFTLPAVDDEGSS